jgi:pimeloyl-ACP methyl ester carboxylesterase
VGCIIFAHAASQFSYEQQAKSSSAAQPKKPAKTDCKYDELLFFRNANHCMTNAWIQRLITVGLLLLGIGYAYHYKQIYSVWFLLIVAVPLVLIAVVEAFQFIALYLVNQNDPAPKATLAQYVKAYGTELWSSLKIFGLWQPFQHRLLSDNLIKDEQQRCGIVLVHGFFCNRAFWNGWMRILQSEGRVYVAVDLTPAFGSIDDYVDLLERAVKQVVDLTGQPAVLVGHSMGGLAVRAWLAQRSKDDKNAQTPQLVKQVITLGTPHQGTWFAAVSHAVNGRQMALSSQWLQSLRQKEQELVKVKYTCFYSNCDNIVFPVSSATLPQADNCMVTALGHVAMAYDKRMQKACWELML